MERGSQSCWELGEMRSLETEGHWGDLKRKNKYKSKNWKWEKCNNFLKKFRK